MEAQNIDEVVKLLDEVIAAYRTRSTRLAFFPALYRGVTVRVRALLGTGTFEDDARMDRFDTLFANRYFAALERTQDRESVPRAWRVAFDMEPRTDLMILQHLLLGINAHINFDLPVAAVTAAPGAALPALRSDFMKINEILFDLLETVQGTINRFSPLLDLLDRVGGRTDELLVGFSIKTSRDEAWHEATRLSREEGPVRERSIISIDRRVALLGQHIIVPAGPCGLATALISRTESDDVRAVTDALLAIQ